jgi:hypothetical protein
MSQQDMRTLKTFVPRFAGIAIAIAVVFSTIVLSCGGGNTAALPPAPKDSLRWDPFLDTLQERTLRYFLETTPESGLAYDRYPSRSPSSIGAVGFALTAYPIAVERGLISREEAVRRVVHTLRFLYSLPQHDGATDVSGYKGFFYHFLDVRDGRRYWKCELSTIDTGLMLMGALMCQTYFDAANGDEKDLRGLADSLYFRVDWQWATNGKPGISHGWYPEKGFNKTQWQGYDESAFLIMLALGSPTHPVRDGLWEYWTEPCIWAEYYGSSFVSFAPLFGHQYSFCWIDFRGIQDRFIREKKIDYFENSRRATYSHRAYAHENPKEMVGYSDSVWGLTAGDGPGDTTFSVDGMYRRFTGYSARGVSFDWKNDDGTIAPAAAGGSLPFAPEICIPALKTMRRLHGDKLFRQYGFADGFNRTYRTPSWPDGWYDPDHLGIDQGPIVIMIENLRNEFVWRTMMKNPYLLRGLRRAGFSGGWLDAKRTGGTGK